MGLIKQHIIKKKYNIDKQSLYGIDGVDSNIPITLEKEFCIENAYFKIGQIKGTKVHQEILIYIYENEESNKIIDIIEDNYIPNVDDDSTNFIKQAYEYLKTLPEYTDAMDC